VKMKIRIIALCLSLLSVFAVSAQNFPEVPNPPRIVNDFANTMSPEEVAALEQKLAAFSDTTSTQIAVVTIADLEGYDVADYADRLAEKWGIGQKGTNNGLLILVKPKNDQPGKARISVGYGLEEIIPDAISRRIVDNEMIPEFKKGSYYKGIDKASNVVISLATGKFKAKDYKGKEQGTPIWIVVVFIVIVIVLMRVFRGSSGVYHQGGSSLPFWTALFMANQMGSNRGSGWSDFSSGGGMFGGGSSGGGFGGFGGGSFGGGGASGSW
jgi:uncharacterized protein